MKHFFASRSCLKCPHPSTVRNTTCIGLCKTECHLAAVCNHATLPLAALLHDDFVSRVTCALLANQGRFSRRYANKVPRLVQSAF